MRYAVALGKNARGKTFYMSRHCGYSELSLRSRHTWTTTDRAAAERAVDEYGGEIVEVQP